ncbi:hypothetical protein L7F22_032022 [Adiantum nelumboides]|nr:hypothetical protein [Adiantum nelumboides]
METCSFITNELLNVESKHWEDLPVDLLAHILSFADHRTVIIAGGVCTGWRDALNLGISKLSFKWCHQNVSNLVQSVAPKFSKLQACQLWNSRSYLKDEAVIALASHCHDLQDLDLSKGTLITDDSLFALAQGCKLLEKLNLSGCSKITEQGVISLAEQCGGPLKSLDLCGCKKAVTDQALLALAGNCIDLQELNLGWCDMTTDIGVTGLASGCSNLRRIDLCGCWQITDRSVIALADKCHCLCVLDLYSCVRITDAAMHALANSSKNRLLQTNEKRRFQQSKSDSIDGGINSLNVGMCTLLSVQAVQAVCDAFLGLHTCAERHSLNISACHHLRPVHCACVIEAARKQRPIQMQSPMLAL